MKQRILAGMAALIVMIALVSAAGCAAKQRHIATVSVVAGHQALALIQDTEMLLVCGKSTAPAAGQCVPQDVHQNEISPKLAAAFQYDASIARTVRDWPVGTPPPATIGELMGKINAIIQDVLRHMPESALKTKLVFQLGS